MASFKNIADDELLFKKYLNDVFIKAADDSLAKTTDCHPRLLPILENDILHLKTQKERLELEIKKRHLEDRDLWSGLQVQGETDVPD